MFSFVKSTSTWVSLPGTINGGGDVKYVVSINLEKASISKANFVISDNVNPRFCVPVSSLIDVNYGEKEIEFTFHDYGEYHIALYSENSRIIEMFVSQLNICSTINTLVVDNFQQENWAFMKAFGVEHSIFPSDHIKPNPSVLLPIGYEYTYKTWKKRNMHMNFSYISELTDFRMCFLTYNVAQQKPSAEIVPKITEAITGSQSDAIFIALEEIDFGAKAVVVGTSSAKDLWSGVFRKVSRAVENDYALIKSCSLGGVYAAVFVRPDLPTHFTVMEPKTLRFGVGGIMANKSAIIFPLKVSEATLTVVAAHLSAHVGHNKERLAEIDQIVKNNQNSDYTVILGDLNFRILIEYELALQYAKEGNIEMLKETDELLAALKFTDSLKNFREGEIDFLPTYKYELGQNIYDQSPKKRVPAYTDRVIVKTGEPRIAVGPSDQLVFESDIIRAKVKGYEFKTPDYFGMEEPERNYPIPPTCEKYSRIDCRYSDHRPVFAIYNFKVPHFKEDRVEELDKLMQEKRNDALLLTKPIVEATCETDKIVLSNTGACWAKWSAEANGTRINVKNGILFPGDTINIVATVTGDDPKVIIDIENGDILEVIPVNNKLFN